MNPTFVKYIITQGAALHLPVRFDSNDYEDTLHFVESLMTRRADKTLRSNPRRNFPSHPFSKDLIRILMETLAADHLSAT